MALRCYEQSLELWRQLNNEYSQAVAMMMIGQILAYEQNDFASALTYLQKSLEILQRLNSPDLETVMDIITRVQQMVKNQEN